MSACSCEVPSKSHGILICFGILIQIDNLSNGMSN